MSVFMDLNLMFSVDKKRMQSLIKTAAHLGFSTIAINYVFEPKTRKKQELPTPMPISELIDQLPVVQGRSHPIRVLNRLTMVVSDPCHFRPITPDYRCFDLLAVQPTTEKLFHVACMEYDLDIICISMTEKLPFFFKRAPVNGAIDRGVVFEVSYAAAIRHSTMRCHMIANAVYLMENCKGKNVIVSSAAEKALELRGPYDIANLGLLFGLSDRDAKESISSTCRSVVLHGETRKTALGIVYTVRTPRDTPQDTPQNTSQDTPQDMPQDSGDSEAPAAKRVKST